VTSTERITERLRSGFTAFDESERATGEHCPSTERIWDGVHGRLGPEETQSIALHLAECTSCTYDWGVAMQSAERTAEAAQPVALRRPRTRWAMAGAAAAALIVVGFLTVLRQTSLFQPDETSFRATDEESIRSLVPDGDALPREDAVLRWTPVAEDARYSVEVGLPDLTPLASAHDLRETEYRIPAAALETVEPGGTVIWQVEAGLPDGRHIVSEAFLAKIE
jgi:hypothetical protein